jgi:beta-glucosidase
MRFDLFECQYDLGLFQDPYKYCDETEQAKTVSTKDHTKPEKISQSLVLLKTKTDCFLLKKTGTMVL